LIPGRQPTSDTALVQFTNLDYGSFVRRVIAQRHRGAPSRGGEQDRRCRRLPTQFLREIIVVVVVGGGGDGDWGGSSGCGRLTDETVPDGTEACDWRPATKRRLSAIARRRSSARSGLVRSAVDEVALND